MLAITLARTMRNIVLLNKTQYLQSRDSLTGSLNLDGFKHRAAQLIERHPQQPYALIHTDIKNFKYINDIFGYNTGDSLLRFLSSLLSRNLGKNETFCRTSADHFYILMAYNGEDALRETFTQYGKQLQEFVSLLDKHFILELVTGVYRIPQPDDADLNIMLDRATLAQKQAKDGMETLCFFTDGLWESQLRALAITQMLSSSLESGAVTVWFQPQYNYTTGNLVGAEALARWTHPTLGPLSPAEFIPVLERNGQILQLDKYIWEQACLHMRKWLDDDCTIAPVSVSINISRLDVYSPSLSTVLQELIKKYRLSPSMLKLEITENAYIENPDQLIKTIKELRALGFSVEMDDFGSGYSSLNSLKDVPVDMLKLDFKFLSGKENTGRGGNILSSVVRMAHWLSLPVLAEGVETKEQADYLKGLGCNLMQGYYFSRPLPAEQFEALLHKSTVERFTLQGDPVEILNTEEFLNTSSKTSFLFNQCIGGAALFEWFGGNLESLLTNDQYFTAIGIDRAAYDYMRLNTLNCIHKNDRGLMAASLDRAVEQGSASCEVRAVLSGTLEPRYLRFQHQYLSSRDQRHILFSLVDDVSQHHHVAQQLHQTTIELQSFIGLLPGGVFRYRADASEQFDSVSQGLLDMLGYTKAQFTVKFKNRFSDMIFEGDRARALKALNEETAQGHTGHCEYRIETASGKIATQGIW